MTALIALGVLFAGYAAAIWAVFTATPALLGAALVATVIGVGIMHIDGRRAIPGRPARARGMAAMMLSAFFVAAAVVAWLVALWLMPGVGSGEAVAGFYTVAATWYCIRSVVAAVGVMTGRI